MDNYGFTDNISLRTGAYLPQVRLQFKEARPVLIDGDIAQVAKMELTFPPFAVCNTRRIPMPASRFTVGRTAIPVFVDMDRINPRRDTPISIENATVSSNWVKVATPYSSPSPKAPISAYACFAVKIAIISSELMQLIVVMLINNNTATTTVWLIFLVLSPINKIKNNNIPQPFFVAKGCDMSILIVRCISGITILC